MKCGKLAIAALTLAASFAFAGAASAEKMTMKVPLTAAASVPPNSSGGKGEADITYDTATKLLTWKVTYSGLTGPATMAHFHGPADPGKNAGVLIPFKDASSGATGSATLTDAQAADLLAGKLYVNVHTEANKGGEIRGQVVK